jgi:hypothetical protein
MRLAAGRAAHREGDEWTAKLGADHRYTKACAANLKLDETSRSHVGEERTDLAFDPPRI